MQPVPLVLGILLLLFMGLTLHRARRLRRLIHRLEHLRPVPILQATFGLVQVHAHASSPSPLESPFQKKSCCYYYFRVEEPQATDPRGRLRARRLATGKRWADFLINDETGSARVEANAALVSSGHSFQQEFHDLKEIPTEHAEFFEAAGIDARHLPRFQRLRVVEYTIEPGDKVHVTGTVREQDGEKVFYRARHSPLIVSAEADVGLAAGLRRELLLFSAAPALFGVFGLLFLVVAFF